MLGSEMTVVALVVLFLSAGCFSMGPVFHVSPSGDDGGAGTAEAPLASLTGARQPTCRTGRGRRARDNVSFELSSIADVLGCAT